MGRVTYTLAQISDTCTIEGQRCFEDIWFNDAGDGTVLSLQGLDTNKPYWITPIDSETWTRANNRHFRWYHIIPNYTDHYEASLVTDASRCVGAWTCVYSPMMCQKIVDYFHTLPKYCHKVTHTCTVLSNPGYIERFDRLTSMFNTCAQSPNTVITVVTY